MSDFVVSRAQWVQRLFPAGLPRLWCPPLTHFTSTGAIARDRIAAHLRYLGRHSRGWLIPGSTGEGWQMNDQEIRELLDHTLTIAQQVGARVLVGVLRKDSTSTAQCIRQTVDWLCRRAATDDPLQAMTCQHVGGFTVCPPTGQQLTDNDLRSQLRALLQMNLPMALYQLPQVTQNEMSPQLVADLAAEFPNFYLFKDTSGADRVTMSSADLQDVFLVRGAEGRYADWLKDAGGPYDGFLLSTANVFAARLAEMIELLSHGNADAARRAVAPVQQAVDKVFALVAGVPWGNPFTNANKAMDHFMAYGADAGNAPLPYLHDGQALPADILNSTRDILAQTALLPEIGYLAAA
jgi:dihydrodipicolinate synthase/N-acetylneuraminate lyase